MERQNGLRIMALWAKSPENGAFQMPFSRFATVETAHFRLQRVATPSSGSQGIDGTEGRSGCGPEVARPQHFVQVRTGWRAPLRHGADLLPDLPSVLVAVPELVGDLRRNSAPLRIGLDVFDHLDFGLAETFDQLAGFNRRRMPFARRLDQLAASFRLFAQGSEPVRAWDWRSTTRWRFGLAGRRRWKRTLRESLTHVERHDGCGQRQNQAADRQGVFSGGDNGM
jgi:hypothetical protein